MKIKKLRGVAQIVFFLYSSYPWSIMVFESCQFNRKDEEQ